MMNQPKMTRWTTALVVLVLAVVTGIDSVGQTAGAFTRLGFGARGIGMSNALSADVSGTASPFYNPALAPFVEKQTLSASAALLRFDRNLQFLEFTSPLRPRAGVAVGMIHAGVTNIDGRDNSGFHTQDYTVEEFAFFLAFGLKFGERASGGIALQLFRSDLFNDISPVNSIGIDIGFTFQVHKTTRLAFVAEDLLAEYSFDTSGLLGNGGKTTEDPFPRRIRLGASHGLPSWATTLYAEYEMSTTKREARSEEVQIVGGVPTTVVRSEDLSIFESRLRVGGEYQLSPELAVRAGFDQLRSDLGGFKPSAGFSVKYPVGKLLTAAEYAFVLEPYAVGTMHLITLKIFL